MEERIEPSTLQTVGRVHYDTVLIMNPSATQPIFRVTILVVSPLLLFSSVASSESQLAIEGRLRNHHVATVMKGNKSNKSLEPSSKTMSKSKADKSSKGSKSKRSKAQTATPTTGPTTTTTNSTSTVPTSTATSTPTSQTTASPTNAPTSSTSSTSTSTLTSVPTSQPTNTNNSSLKNDQTSSLLVWKGVRRCSPTTPCPACSGDCDTDDDCMDGLMCYKRIGGSYATVPGCDIGGFGDVGGGDYCYYNTQQASIPKLSRTTSSFATSGGLNEDHAVVFDWEVATVSRWNEPTVSKTYTPTNALEKDGDDDDVFEWREDVEN